MSDVATLNNVRSHTRRGTLALFFLTPVVISAVPRLTWLFLPLIALALSVPVLRRRRGEWRQLFQPNTAFIAVLLVAIYIFLNATWAADQGAAFGAAALLLGLALFTLAASTAVAESDELQLRRAALAFTAGAFFGALFVLFELLTKGLITRAVMNAIPLLQPDSAKHVRFSNGEVTKIKFSVFNRNVAIVMFNLWPGLLVLRTIEDGTRRAVLTALFLLAVAVPVIISKHDSSQVALIGSTLVFILACAWRRLVIRALAVLWCAAFILVLPVNFLAYKADLHLAPWLPTSARARVIIWEYTSERVLDHPWLGIGADSTPALKTPRGVAEQPKGYVLPRMTGWHAHSLFLQTWYELGVAGVILMAFAGAAVVLRISLLPFEAQPFAAATFAVFVAIAAFAWGMWQPWLMCAVGLVLLYIRMAAGTVQDGTRNPA
jgi:O-antigen ligase